MMIEKKEILNEGRKLAMEKELGCTFSERGKYAEMSMDIKDYREQTRPVDGISFGFYAGNAAELQDIVQTVEEDWVQYFKEDTCVFCGFLEDIIVSFCIVSLDENTIISREGIKVGSIGCVGTLPAYRSKGIGLRMVDLATVYLQQQNCDKAYISYTHIEGWYRQLGYRTFARFSLDEK